MSFLTTGFSNIATTLTTPTTTTNTTSNTGTATTRAVPRSVAYPEQLNPYYVEPHSFTYQPYTSTVSSPLDGRSYRSDAPIDELNKTEVHISILKSEIATLRTEITNYRMSSTGSSTFAHKSAAQARNLSLKKMGEHIDFVMSSIEDAANDGKKSIQLYHSIWAEEHSSVKVNIISYLTLGGYVTRFSRNEERPYTTITW